MPRQFRMNNLLVAGHAREVREGEFLHDSACFPGHLRLPGTPPREYYAFVPPGSEGRAPLVLVHGISRNAAEVVTRFAALSEALQVPLIAPVYRKEHYGMYQQVLDQRRRTRADHALFDILRDASTRWQLDCNRFHLCGFSGGGQFAHRFALLHPRRLLSCIPVSSGWYSWPDDRLSWPLGLARAPGSAIDAAGVALLPIHVIVGDRDTRSGEALRRSPVLDALQGSNRVERAQRWCEAMKLSGLGPNCSLTLLPGAHHSFRSADRHGLVQLAFSLLGFTSGVQGGFQ